MEDQLITIAGKPDMLVLNRQTDEDIMVGRDIFIRVCQIRSDKVKIGVQAPQCVPVHRREVYDAIHKDAPSIAERDAAAERLADRLSVSALNPITLKPWTREQIVALTYVDEDVAAEVQREVDAD